MRVELPMVDFLPTTVFRPACPETKIRARVPKRFPIVSKINFGTYSRNPRVNLYCGQHFPHEASCHRGVVVQQQNVYSPIGEGVSYSNITSCRKSQITALP